MHALGGGHLWGVIRSKAFRFPGYIEERGLEELTKQRIYGILQRYDRLNLARLKAHSRLPDRQLQHGLAAMIQQHLVFHYTSFDDGVTYYEANQQAAYYLLRSGKILELIEDRLGEYAAKVMSTIIYLGHAQVSDLEVIPELGQSGSNGEVNGTGNGTANGIGDRTGELHATLKTLAAHGYIHRVRDAHFQSYTDTALDAERVVQSRPEIKALKGKKLEETVIEKTLELVRERTDGDLSRGLTYNGVPRGLNKKRTSNADDEENEWLDDEGDTPMDVGPPPPADEMGETDKQARCGRAGELHKTRRRTA